MEVPVHHVGPEREGPSATEATEAGDPAMLGGIIVPVKPEPLYIVADSVGIMPAALFVRTMVDNRKQIETLFHFHLLSV